MIFAIRDYRYSATKDAMIDNQHTYYVNSKYIECITIPDDGDYAKLCLSHNRGDQFFTIEKKRAIEIALIMEQEN